MSLEKKIYIPIVRKRKKKKKKKIVCLNYYFSSTRIGKKLSSYFIRSGQKQKSNLVYFKLLFKLKQLQPKSSPTFIIKKALINSLPFYETRSYKKRGRTTIATLPVYTKKRRLFLLIKYIKTYLKPIEQQYSVKYANLILQLSKKQGLFFKTLKKKYQTTLKQYPQLHFRWK